MMMRNQNTIDSYGFEPFCQYTFIQRVHVVQQQLIYFWTVRSWKVETWYVDLSSFDMNVLMYYFFEIFETSEADVAIIEFSSKFDRMSFWIGEA